jgi:hypothetical protein
VTPRASVGRYAVHFLRRKSNGKLTITSRSASLFHETVVFGRVIHTHRSFNWHVRAPTPDPVTTTSLTPNSTLIPCFDRASGGGEDEIQAAGCPYGSRTSRILEMPTLFPRRNSL